MKAQDPCDREEDPDHEHPPVTILQREETGSEESNRYKKVPIPIPHHTAASLSGSPGFSLLRPGLPSRVIHCP